MTVYLVFMGFNYASGFRESFPDHLLTTIYCFGIIPKPFEAYINYFIEENEIVFIGEPYVSHSSSLKT